MINLQNINANKLVLWITAIQFVFTMIFYWVTFSKINDNQPQVHIDNSAIKAVEKKAAQLEKDYKASEKIYKAKIEELNRKLIVTELKLVKAKNLSSLQQDKIEETLDRNWDTIPDAEKLTLCDSLRDQVENFIESQEKKDSLYEDNISQLKQAQLVTENQLLKCDTTRAELQSQLETAIDQNKEATKQLKKQKRRKTFWKIGAGIITVITLGLALK